MSQIKRIGQNSLIILGLMLAASPAVAQFEVDPTGRIETPPTPNTPADQLSANLVALSRNPKDVAALLSAGLSAIAIGDGEAAFSFLGRAEVLSPSNGGVKAGLGSAYVLTERPADALRLFSEATALGVPDALFARDRGLAYDLQGDPRRAQRDYALALRAGPDDEVTRRFALSLAISGERDKALIMLDPLLRKHDQAGWRARAFVLALSGDVRGAENIAQTVMTGSSGASLSPFFRQLAKLNPSERAFAVNFGSMPGDRPQLASAGSADTYRPAIAPSNSAESMTASREPRRIPGRAPAEVAVRTDPLPPPGPAVPSWSSKPVSQPVSQPIPSAEPPPVRMTQRLDTRIGPVDRTKLDPAIQAVLSGTGPKPAVALAPEQRLPTPNQEMKPVQVATLALPSNVIAAQINARSLPAPVATPPVFEVPTVVPQPAAPTPIVQEIVRPMPAPVETKLAEVTPVTPAIVVPAAPVGPVSSVAVAAPAPEPAPVVVPAPIATPPLEQGLASIMAAIQPESESIAAPLPTAKQLKAARLLAQQKAEATALAEEVAKAAAAQKEAERLALKKAPPRLWVQVATGANEAGLPITWKHLKEKAPDLFKGMAASTVPYKSTNRLLVGPFKSPSDARALVNAMQKAGLFGSTFSSDAGQEIGKVSAR
jgi:Flp pilus assembly protein TadD